MIRRPPRSTPLSLHDALPICDGLAQRGFGPAAVRLGWQAALRAPNDARVLRAIFPWPNRSAVEAEAAEFGRSEEHTSELQSRLHLVCRLLLEKKKKYAGRSAS